MQIFLPMCDWLGHVGTSTFVGSAWFGEDKYSHSWAGCHQHVGLFSNLSCFVFSFTVNACGQGETFLRYITLGLLHLKSLKIILILLWEYYGLHIVAEMIPFIEVEDRDKRRINFIVTCIGMSVCVSVSVFVFVNPPMTRKSPHQLLNVNTFPHRSGRVLLPTDWIITLQPHEKVSF